MVVGKFGSGGAEALLMNLFRNIDRSQFVFDFAVHDDNDGFYGKEAKELGGKVYYFPKYKIFNGIKYRKCWKKFFKEHAKEYQIIHTHHSSSVSMILKIAKKFGLYTIAHSHSAGWDKSLMGLGNRLLSHGTRKVADHFFACSYEAAVAQFGKKVANDKSRCEIIKNGIPVNKYVYNESIRKLIRKELGVSDNVHLYGHVGRFTYAKNHQFLLKVYAEILKKDNNSKLLLIGGGDLKSNIISQIKELKLEDHVILAGEKNNVNDYLQAMDYFIFPSNYEGLGIVLIEAQASGLRCMKSDVIPNEVDITDLVSHMSLNESPSNWANKILENIEYSRQNMAKFVEKSGYDIKTSVEHLSSFYLEIIRKRK